MTPGARAVKACRANRMPAPFLVAAFGACLVAGAWANALWGLARERRAEIERAYGQNAALARSYEEHVRGALHAAEGALLFLQDEWQRGGSVTESARRYARRTLSDPVFNQLSIADRSGKLILSAVPLAKPVNIARREHFRVHAQSPDVGVFVGRPVVSLATGGWSFFLSRRLSAPDGSFAGVVSVGLDPEYFAAYYGDPELGRDRAVVLVGRDHIVRARHFRHNLSLGQDMGESPLFRLVEQRAVGRYEVLGVLDGVPRFANYRALPDYPLIVAVSVAKDATLAPFRQRRAFDLATTSIFTVFVVGFCALLARAETRSERQRRALEAELGERRRTEEALRESEGIFSAFMDRMPGIAFLKGEDDRVLYTNEAFRRLFGAGLVGETTAALPGVPPETVESMRRDDEQVLREGELVLEERVRDATGRERVFETRKFVVTREGKPPLVGGISIDITRRIEEERDRLAFERQLQQTQKMESLGVLAGGIAHDFNNLLMGILGNLDLALGKTPASAPTRTYLERAVAATERAAELANQMLAYSGKGRFLIERMDLSRLVEELWPLLATVVSKRAVVRQRLAADLPLVEADATQLRQVIMNLITNASDALEGRNGFMEVETGVVEASGSLPPGRYVYLQVTDNGCGMDPATQTRIYDPFFTTKETGRGLGLAAVLGIVRGHGGEIEVRSDPGRGSTFRVLLPAARPGDDPAAGT